VDLPHDAGQRLDASLRRLRRHTRQQLVVQQRRHADRTYPFG
jgi:hypothetical protein